jgi:hypothetical protein
MISTLAFRNLALRPWRTLLLLAGFGLGVGVMITLLSIGDAMVAQARDEKIVGGGDVTVLPDGVYIELLKTGGVGQGARRLSSASRVAAPAEYR